MSNNAGRKEFRRDLCTDRLIRAAKDMGLETDGTMIWSKNEDGTVDKSYQIDPYLLDRLARIYSEEGHLVFVGGDLLWDDEFSQGDLSEMGKAMTLEEYRELAAEGREPRVNFRRKVEFEIDAFNDDDVPEEWADSYSFGHPEVADLGFDAPRSLDPEGYEGVLDGIDSNPTLRYGGEVRRRRPDPGFPSPAELATYEVVER